MDELLDRIRERIADGQPNDHPGQWLAVLPPTSPDHVVEVERQLGFRLPELLRRLYLEIGNGGFGPVFGLIPLSLVSLGGASPAEAEFDLLGDYLRLVRRFPADQPNVWPTGLVPAFYCGCTTFEFVDCRHPDGPVVWFDEGTEKPSELLDREAIPSLKQWLESWLDGDQAW